jgi:hypothetical protein
MISDSSPCVILDSLVDFITKVHNLTLTLKTSVKEKHTSSLTPFNWKDCNAPELRNHGFITRRGNRLFSSANNSDWLMGLTQAPNKWVLGQLGQEAYHSPLTTTEAKNEWSYTSNPPYVFMVCRQL